MVNELGEAGLVTVGKLIDGWKSGAADSYVDYTRPSRVEPNLIVDSSLLFYENTPVVTQSLHSAFSAYYLLAWNMLQASVNNISVMRHLDKLNPNRSVQNSLVDTAGAIFIASNENYKYRLPALISNEARNNQDNDGIMEPAGLAARSTEVIKEASNLSVGKILEVQIAYGQNKQSLPVLIRLHASTMVPSMMADFLSTGNADNTVGTRIIKWRTGQINFLDLLTARDLVKEHKKNLMRDTSGIYTATATQRRGNKLSGMLSMNPSVANSTNLVVVDSETIKKLELQINEKFSDFRARQRLFESTGLFIVAVVDREYDRVSFYTTGIPTASTVSIKECITANNKKDSSITDILKAYQIGNAPSF